MMARLLGCLFAVATVACSPSSPLAPAVPPVATAATSSGGSTGPIEPGTINFNGLSSNGAPISEYRERGFLLRLSGAEWTELHTYGNLQPSVIFKVGAGASASGTVEVSGGGETFSFAGVDLYSSTTRIPYRIVGLRNGAGVFAVDGELPNTFGNFRKVDGVAGTIDTLRITLTNNAAPCCSNPMGLDNIVLR